MENRKPIRFPTLDAACDFIKNVDSKVILEYRIIYNMEKDHEFWTVKARVIIIGSMGKSKWVDQ